MPGSRDATVLHMIVDMQRMFAEATPWHTPALAGIVPNILRLLEHGPRRRLFTRFVVPPTPEVAHGQWQAYYRHWRAMTGERLAPGMIDLIPEFAEHARPEELFDKPTYSAFAVPGLAESLRADGVETLVISGVESDACVLATLLDAVDHGFHVIVPTDAVASSSPEGHRAVLDHVLPRLGQQVRLTSVSMLVGG